MKIVEKALVNMNESVITRAKLKKRLPRSIDLKTYRAVLAHLDKTNKIAFGWRGITWICNPKLGRYLKRHWVEMREL